MCIEFGDWDFFSVVGLVVGGVIGGDCCSGVLSVFGLIGWYFSGVGIIMWR